MQPIVTAASQAEQDQAVALAKAIGLALAPGHGLSTGLHLRVGPDRLELIKPGDPHLGGAVYADFQSHQALNRLSAPHRELLVRAVGLKRVRQPLVVDAAAGLGRDGFLLAAAGCRVIMVERHPVVAALLADGLTRAANDQRTASIQARISLVRGDFLDLPLTTHPDVVYLDPMFPAKTKNTRVKKDLQMLQLLTDSEVVSGEQLFTHALALGPQKIVVKRALHAPALTARKPGHTIRGKTIRFDVYPVYPGR